MQAYHTLARHMRTHYLSDGCRNINAYRVSKGPGSIHYSIQIILMLYYIKFYHIILVYNNINRLAYC